MNWRIAPPLFVHWSLFSHLLEVRMQFAEHRGLTGVNQSSHRNRRTAVPLRAVPIFQVYRLRDRDGVWWRLMSPNGRPLAISVPVFSTQSAALEHLQQMVARRGQMQASVRVTNSHRWQWTLTLDGEPVVKGAGEQDRRLRCEAGWEHFVQVAPTAAVDASVHLYSSGSANPTGELNQGTRHER